MIQNVTQEDAGVGNKLADAVQINWVWMPPWGPNMITEEGRDFRKT